MRKISNHFNQVVQSLKMREVEEKYDIYFSRFIGLYLAYLARWLNLTPTQVTFLSVLCGFVGGGLLFFQYQFWVIVVASIFITLAGLLDSADGQLARMTGQSSEYGRILDGAADSMVFIFCYVGATSYFVFGQGGHWAYIPLGFLSGYIHTLESGVYDLYKSEILYYCGHFKDHRLVSKEELREQLNSKKGFQRLMYSFYLNYVGKQHLGSSRMKNMAKFREFSENEKTREPFREAYRIHHVHLLKGWAWVGGLNIHRWGIIISSLFGRFDVYLWAVLVSVLGLIFMNYLATKADSRVLSDLKLKGFV